MSSLRKLFVLGICLSATLHADWDFRILQQENLNDAPLNGREYNNLKLQVLQTLANSWCSAEKINLLMDLTLITRPKVCIEVGVFTGSSVLPVAATLKYLNSGKIFAIDAWSNTQATKYLVNDDPNKEWWSQVDMKNARSHFHTLINAWRLGNFCDEIYKSSEQAIHNIPENIDFLHLDGNFSEEGALRDVELYLPKIKYGGYILLSNLCIMINGQQLKLKSFHKILETCDIIAEIDNGNTILFRKGIERFDLYKDQNDDVNNILKKSYIVGNLLGQLGNQMFEIAAASALAWDNDAEACFPDLISTSNEYLHIFFRCNRSSPKDPITFEWSPGCPFDYQPIPYQPNMKLNDYFQNEQYFKHHREKLLDLFAPHAKDLKDIQVKYNEILSHPKSVSVHVKYYPREKPDEDTFIQYEREYYEKAMNLFPSDSLFVVISDNIPFAKENIPCSGRNVIFIEKEPFYIDFYLQTLCKSNIISNSAISWWGAWLNRNENKIVVRPKEWFKGYPDMEGPSDWIKIEAQ